MTDLTSLLIRLSAAVFTGAAAYISLVEHPTRIAMARTAPGTPSDAARQFTASLPRAERMQPPLLVLCLIGCAILAVRDATVSLLVGAALLATIVPLSFAVLVPINRRLLSHPRGDHPDTAGPLHRWGRWHHVRSALAMAGTIVLFL